MATLSTLELMLHQIQNQQNLESYSDLGRMPTLPQRPVSRARMPTRRVRNAILSFHLKEIGGKMNEEFFNADKYAFINVGLVLSKNEMKNSLEEKAEKSAILIQKCFRSYQARFRYLKIKEGIITLQSYVRGENARRKFQNSTRLTQMQIHQEFVWKPLRNKVATIIYLQSVVRSWLSRRHIEYTENATIENMRETNDDIHNENVKSEEHVMVSKSYIHDLEQQVLKTEAALQHKKHENSILELRIQQIDRKWELHKAKMHLKEKVWQDEYKSIQMNLASARERMSKEITRVPRSHAQCQENVKKKLTIRQILERQESDYGFRVDVMLNSRKAQEQEFRKLKSRFKAWKTEFKARLYDIKKTLDRFDHCRTERVHKSCLNILE
ncbi:myosin-2-like [Rutidosis leptorrhynchoides]|uniref:myosin-2-like n=1 Tax=Rutidosis leptorrhynchoides TaxID=125765 RepID=UPI003A991551